MGNFSWLTMEGNPIVNRRFGARMKRWRKFTVYMHAPRCDAFPSGAVWTEKKYGGYGVFGGKDYFVALAQINGKKLSDYMTSVPKNANLAATNNAEAERRHKRALEDLRMAGIDIAHSSNNGGVEHVRYPILSESSEWSGSFSSANPDDENQGDWYDSDGETESEAGDDEEDGTDYNVDAYKPPSAHDQRAAADALQVEETRKRKRALSAKLNRAQRNLDGLEEKSRAKMEADRKKFQAAIDDMLAELQQFE